MMVRRDGAEVRRERIQQITSRVLSLLHKHGEIRLKKTLATLEYETGLKRETLIEYLKTGEDTDHFTLDFENDKIKKIAEADSDE